MTVRAGRFPRDVVGILVVAFLARLALAWISIGSNDAVLWERFARQIDEDGLVAVYRGLRAFNHPPAIAYLQWILWLIAEATGLRFALLLKLLPITMDVGIIFFAYPILKSRPWLLWMLALNPASVLVSAYHGNTDSICAAFCVLALLALERNRFAVASALLAAAFNVKLIPAVLLIPFLVRVHHLGGAPQLRRALLVLSFGALPFLPIFVLDAPAFYRNAVAYNSLVAEWGLHVIAQSLRAVSVDLAKLLSRLTVANGKQWVLASAWLLGSLQARQSGPQSLACGALAFASFLVFAPGFGVQYVIYPVAALLITSPRTGVLYACIAGTFILSVYIGFWTGTYPLLSYFDGPFNVTAQRIGFVAWTVLLIYVVRTGWRLLRDFVRGERRPIRAC